MTAATHYAQSNIAADAIAIPAAVRALLVPVLALVTFLAAWAGATAVWGFNGFIGGADAAVLLVFAVILRLTRQ
jgi:hypothetical protein